MATFLLEVGTEELPADFARLVIPQIKNLVARDFRQRRLNYGIIKCTTTPRRIILIVEGLAGSANDSEELYKGPPATKAFEDGSPSKAAFGFAKRFDLDPSFLEVRETPKGEFVYAKVLTRGANTFDLLSEMIPEWISNMQGRRFMRWGMGEKRFSRPVRWIVALLDQSVVPLSLECTDPTVISGNLSRGHRLHQSEVVINSAEDYSSLLKQVGVQIDREERKEFIRNSINSTSKNINAVPDLSDELLDELTDLVESPSIICGEFDDSYLNLPAEVLSTVMQVHQRYVPLYLNNSCHDPLALHAKERLFAKFLCVCNSLSSARETIQHGNERVLRARLADAVFFINADLSRTSADRCKQLSHVTFAKGLGTLLERVDRIKWITKVILEQLNNSNIDRQNVLKAAQFCKHDLVSQMVGEFPELQGILGGKYLLAEGENREVALAVLEHYLPRGAGDDLPKSDAGAVLALADKVELLLSIFAKGERPSGSSDPYALRRAGNGILQIIWNKGWQLDIDLLLKESINHWTEIFSGLNINKTQQFTDLSEFFRQRLISLLEDSNLDNDLVQSVAGPRIGIDRLLSDPADAQLRAKLLQKMRQTGELQAIQTVVVRASRLAEKSDLDSNILSPSQVVEPTLFKKTSEDNLLATLNYLESIVSGKSIDRYLDLAEGLASSLDLLSAFFDGDQSVMVMTDDKKVRTNRLNLLAVFCNQASVLADFTKINS